MKTVIIADNHPLFRAGVRQLIESDPNFRLLDEAGDTESCLLKVAEHQPNILLLDLNMPSTSGFDVVRTLKDQRNPCRIVILSTYASRDFVETAQQLGCAGFVAKEDAGTELLLALLNLGHGFQMSSSVGRGEAPIAVPSQSRPAGFDASLLTMTELRVLAEIAASETSRNIADKLGVSPRTVETHRQNISRKIELSGANSLVRFAAENKDQIASAISGG